MSKKTTNAATKANRVRKARQEFRAEVGDDIYNVVRILAQGGTSEKAFNATKTITWPSVAAVKANYTRGTYRARVKACNF